MKEVHFARVKVNNEQQVRLPLVIAGGLAAVHFSFASCDECVDAAFRQTLIGAIVVDDAALRVEIPWAVLNVMWSALLGWDTSVSD